MFKKIAFLVNLMFFGSLPGLHAQELKVGKYTLGMEGAEASATMKRIVGAEPEYKGWGNDSRPSFNGYHAGARSGRQPGWEMTNEYTSPLSGNKLVSINWTVFAQPGEIPMNRLASTSQLLGKYGPPSFRGSHRLTWVYADGQVLPEGVDDGYFSGNCALFAVVLLSTTETEKLDQAEDFFLNNKCDKLVIVQMTGKKATEYDALADPVLATRTQMIDAKAIYEDYKKLKENQPQADKQATPKASAPEKPPTPLPAPRTGREIAEAMAACLGYFEVATKVLPPFVVDDIKNTKGQTDTRLRAFARALKLEPSVIEQVTADAVNKFQEIHSEKQEGFYGATIDVQKQCERNIEKADAARSNGTLDTEMQEESKSPAQMPAEEKAKTAPKYRTIRGAVVGKTFGTDNCKGRQIHFGKNFTAAVAAGEMLPASYASYEENKDILRIHTSSLGLISTYRFDGKNLIDEGIEFAGVEISTPQAVMTECDATAFEEPSINREKASKKDAITLGAQFAILFKDLDALKEFREMGVDFQSVVVGKSLFEWADLSSKEIREYVRGGSAKLASAFDELRDGNKPWKPIKHLPPQYQRSFSGVCELGRVTYTNTKKVNAWDGEPPKEEVIAKLYQSGKIIRIEYEKGNSEIMQVRTDGNLLVRSFFESGAPFPGKNSSLLTRCL